MKFARAGSLFFVLLAHPSHAAKDSCIECHSALDGALAKPALIFKDDVHQRHGIRCSDCHGGDPGTLDPEASMSRARGFTGKVSRTAVPKFCARCHADASFMHKYDPKERVDQYAQYLTSVHGKRIAAGDAAAANCVDCHGVHDIREVKNPLSPVHPLRLPETCGRCHTDQARMGKYKIPTDQFEQYRHSVHWEALAKRGDLSAPSCASCHGNHGATPPGASSVAAVCGLCHVLMENLYNKSPHQPVFSSAGMAGCVVCHGDHGVARSSPEMLEGGKAVCAQCHEAGSTGAAAAAEMAGSINGLKSAIGRSEEILLRAMRYGMEVSEAQLRLQEARENLVKARVAVHAFRASEVAAPAGEGLKIALETYQAGEAALREKDRRRIGLGVSLVTIAITMAGLWLAIRRLESPRSSGRE